jgi:hypothetical protein
MALRRRISRCGLRELGTVKSLRGTNCATRSRVPSRAHATRSEAAAAAMYRSSKATISSSPFSSACTVGAYGRASASIVRRPTRRRFQNASQSRRPPTLSGRCSGVCWSPNASIGSALTPGVATPESSSTRVRALSAWIRMGGALPCSPARRCDRGTECVRGARGRRQRSDPSLTRLTRGGACQRRPVHGCPTDRSRSSRRAMPLRCSWLAMRIRLRSMNK